MPASDLAWFDEKGGEIARGSDLVRSPSLAGVASLRPVAQGIGSAEGYVLLSPVGDEQDVCISRPAGTAAEKMFKGAGFPH